MSEENFERRCGVHDVRLRGDAMICRYCRGKTKRMKVVEVETGSVIYEEDMETGETRADGETYPENAVAKTAKPPKTDFRWPAPLSSDKQEHGRVSRSFDGSGGDD